MVEARTQGITVVLSSHVLAELEGVCDHLVLLHKGQILLAGDVGQLSPNGVPLGELALNRMRQAAQEEAA
jgi:ABC-2 type transport system ATP-binding protein